MCVYVYGSFPLSMADMFQDPQGMPETVDSIEPDMYYAFSHTYFPVIKFNL